MPKSKPSSGHVVALDSMRGIGAVQVLAVHCVNAVGTPYSIASIIYETPLLAILINGDAAVQMFFVLSGYVLSASLARNRSARESIQFYIRRVFRIWPAYMVALLFAWGASFFWTVQVPGHPGLSRWIIDLTQVHLRPEQLLWHLLIPGAADRQLPIGWTLTVEVVYSILMPVMYLIATRIHWSVLLAISSLGLFTPHRIAWFALNFALGTVLFVKREPIARFITSLPRVVFAFALAGTLAFAASPMWTGWMVRFKGVLYLPHHPGSFAIMGTGMAVLIALVVNSGGVQRFLQFRPFVFLGRISYSFYVFHFTMILIFTSIVTGYRGPLDGVYLFSAVFAATTLASWIGFELVELPFIRLGNQVCRKVAVWTGATPRSSSIART